MKENPADECRAKKRQKLSYGATSSILLQQF
jgi:hypothetical protein